LLTVYKILGLRKWKIRTLYVLDEHMAALFLTVVLYVTMTSVVKMCQLNVYCKNL